MAGMSPRMKAKKGRFGAGGFAPVVTITSPGTGFSGTTPVAATATAIDSEDGDISPSIIWTSDVDTGLPTGESVSLVLTPATHIITATVTDSGGKTGSDTITITVTA